MPGALYDICNPPGFDPIKVTSTVVMPTSRQTQDYVLCADCEDLLNKTGETWVIPRLATYEKRFALYEMLIREPPLFDTGDITVYPAARIPEIDVEKITGFAMGIFWKASVHSWLGGVSDPRIELGPYSEAVREYLCQEAPFPRNMALMVTVCPLSTAMIAFHDPHETERMDGWRSFACYVPGVQFLLGVGKRLSDEIRDFCFATRPEHPLLVSEHMSRKVNEMFSDFFVKSRKSKAYQKAKAKRALALGPKQPPKPPSKLISHTRRYVVSNANADPSLALLPCAQSRITRDDNLLRVSERRS